MWGALSSRSDSVASFLSVYLGWRSNQGWLRSPVPALATSLAGSEPKAFWYLARASRVVSYLLLWISVCLGLATSSRLSRLWPGGPLAVDLHQYTSLSAMAFSSFHALVLLGIGLLDSQGLRSFSRSGARDTGLFAWSLARLPST